MTDDTLAADWFSKPGDSLRALLQRRGTSTEYLAENLDGGMTAVRGLFDGSLSIDVTRASILAEVVGGTRNFWLTRQAKYEADFERAVQVASGQVDSWLKAVPMPNTTSGLKSSKVSSEDQLRRRMSFFNVSTLASWEERYGKLRANTRFRTSASFDSVEAAVLLWLRSGEIEADLVTTRPWSPDVLERNLEAIRRLSRISAPTRFLPRLRELCAEAGVAVVIVRTPRGCHASGATRLVSADKAMMLLSFRYRSDDQFWFTVFHEIGHLLLHGTSTFVDGDDTIDDEREQEANAFATRCVVPSSHLSKFNSLSAEADSILRFSRAVGVSPGLIVGQMQHQEKIAYNKLNSLKRVWTWRDIEPESN